MTILFQSDWELYPNAIVDTKTRNRSFVELAAKYKIMGIENHLMILQLHNPRLQGIDPYSPHLTMEDMMDIAVECKTNFFYFIRECVRVPGSGYNNPIQFKANRGNIALYWLFFNHVTTMLIQIRQTGKSFSSDVLMTYLLNIRCTDTQINLLTKDDTLRSANLERLKDIEGEIPFYLKQRGKGDIANTEEIQIKSLGNSYTGHLPNKSPKMALNVGRGLTSPITAIDEGAFLPNISISLPAALAAGTAARDMAKLKNEPYGTIITTTAGKKDDRDGAYIHGLLCDSAIWTEKFFDARDMEELHIIVRANSRKKQLRVNCTFNHRQLGYTDQWLKEAIEAAIAVGEDAKRDFLNEWTSGSQSSPLPDHLTKIIRESQIEDFYTSISSPHGYTTRWYIADQYIPQFMATNNIILSIDSSDASGGDDIGMTYRAVKTGEIIAAGTYNETNLIMFSEWICNILIQYPNITLIIERRSTGAMILDYLLLLLPSKGIDPFARIYNKVVQEADEFPERFKEIDKPMYQRNPEIYIKYKKMFGFATSANGATSRSELYSTTLINAAKLTGDSVRDTVLISQILGLVVRNGRVDHEAGNHDDLCISWLLGYWLLSLGKNLQYYGINIRDILVNNATYNKTTIEYTAYDKLEQDFARETVEQLAIQIKDEKDPNIVVRLEQKLKLMYQKLSNTDKQIITVDALIDKLRSEKAQHQRQLFNNRFR